MTPAERDIITAFKRVTFPQHTSRGRFADDMIRLLDQPDTKLTLKQRKYVVQLAIQFRRQISNIAELIGAVHAENLALSPDEHRELPAKPAKPVDTSQGQMFVGQE
jgi:hypothetical protein